VRERHLPLKDLLPNGEVFPVKELVCKRPWMEETADGEFIPRLQENGEPVMIYSQRWAYATFSALMTGRFKEQGIHNIGNLTSLGDDEIRQHLQSFLKELLPIVTAAPREGVDPSLVTQN